MAPSTDTRTVIVLDDDENIVDLLVDILESADYRAIGCKMWTEAMDAISRKNPDLVLLDLKMPTIDGPSMLEFIRGKGLDVPVIVVSGFVTDQVSEDLSKLGVSAFVSKPFRSAEILKEVNAVLDELPSATPKSTDALYDITTPVADRTQPAGSAEGSNEVLAALQKLGGDGSPEPADQEEAPAPVAGELNEVLAALQRNETGAPPPAEPPAASAPPLSATPSPTRPKPLPPPAEAEGFSNDLRGEPTNGRPREDTPDDGGHSISVIGHRQHHRHPPRPRRRFTKRNFFTFGAMFVICVVVAGFMATMKWYASQIDVDEIEVNTEKAITKQTTQEILKQLNDKKIWP
ncbi:MAG: hypothetical protein CME19_24460 [Gemmatimonadetes bacterium]|nr:hypothetical protein [Gemmatimonadota bacterium]